MQTTHDVIQRVRAEYLEMPGLRLNVEQVERLCGIERMLCQAVLDTLVQGNFLCLKSDGRYARMTDGAWPPARAAKVVTVAGRSVKAS
jgi:hypothetical protein